MTSPPPPLKRRWPTRIAMYGLAAAYCFYSVKTQGWTPMAIFVAWLLAVMALAEIGLYFARRAYYRSGGK